MFEPKRLLTIPEQFCESISRPGSDEGQRRQGADLVRSLENLLVHARTECEALSLSGGTTPLLSGDAIERFALATLLNALGTFLMREVKARTNACFNGSIPQGMAHVIVELWGKHLGCDELFRGAVNGISRPHIGGEEFARNAQLNALLRALESLILEEALQLARISSLSDFGTALDWATALVRADRRLHSRPGVEMVAELSAAPSR